MEINQFNELIRRITELDKNALELLLFTNRCHKAVKSGKPENAVTAFFRQGFDLTKLKGIQSGYKTISDEIKESNSRKLISSEEGILLQEASLKLGRRMKKIDSQVKGLRN